MSSGTSRFSAFGILILVVLGVFFYGLMPLYKFYYGQKSEVDNLRDRLARFSYLVDNQEAIEKELQRIEMLDRDGDLFLKGNKKAIASANLRAFLAEIVNRSKGDMISSQDYQAAELDAAIAVGLRLQVSGEIEQLVDLLYELENARPLIFIEDLKVTSSSGRLRNRTVRARRNSAARRARRSLDIRLDVVSYMPGIAK